MKYKRLILILGIIIIQGCLTMSKIDYSVSTSHSREIDIIHVKYGDNPYIRGGVTGLRVLSVHVVPETVTIEWKNKASGKIFKKTIPIKSKIPSDFNFDRDELIIHVNDDNTVNLTFSLELEKYHWIEIDNKRKIISRNPPNYLKNQKFYKQKSNKQNH